MPIIVEGPDGSEVEFPDGTSQQVMTRAMQEKFGGPKTRAPAPTTRPKKSSALDKFTNVGTVEDLILSGKSGRKQATTARERGFQRAKVRQAATKKQVDLPGSGFVDAAASAAGRAMFGLPDIIAAAAEAPFSEKDFGELLDENRGATDFRTEQSTAGNILGMLGGSLMGGLGANAAVRGAGSRLASSSAPGAVRAAGRALEGAATARQGQKFRNVLKMTAGGAAGGGAQAAAEGQDAATGATIGAIAAPAFAGTVAVGKAIARPFLDIAGLPNAGKILQRFTTATMEEMEQAAEAFRRRTGTEPTLFEILPAKDRRSLAKDILGRTDESSAQTAEAVRRRIRNVGPEMASRTRDATAPGRERIVQQMSDDLAVAGGATPSGMVDPVAARAARSPIDMKDLQQAEARATMSGFEDEPVADNLQRIFPTSLQPVVDADGVPTGEVQEVFSDPEVNAALVNAASTLRLRLSPDNEAADIAGLTAGDMTRILRQLAKVPPGTPQSGAAMRAEQVLMDYIDQTSPAAREAIDTMRANWAARARMIEGMAEGGRTRTRESIPVEKSGQAQVVRNAFETPEGQQGRFLGQANALERDFGGTNQDVARRMGRIVESGEEQAAIAGNLGRQPAQAVQEAAEAQTNSMRALAGLDKDKGGRAAEMNPEDLFSILLAASPGAMIRTKAWAVSRLTKLTRLPDERARQIIDLLFSQEPAQVRAAISVLRRSGEQASRALQDIGKATAIGMQAGRLAGEEGPPSDMGQFEEPAQAEEFPTPDEGDQEYGSYDEILADFEANEDPELLDLLDAQFQQESGNQQFDENGQPLASSAGAIGIAQVMPGTAPEAAELAGLPWDEDAYYNDPAYNKLLGIAYMKEMLRRFDGDVELALAAYNAGPGAVESAGGVPNIAETQNYVDRILARR